MIRHYLTKYKDEKGGRRYAESWLQLGFFDFNFCFCKKRIEI